MSPQSTVRLDSDVVDELRTYSRLSGVPINRVIEEAIENYMGSTIQARLRFWRKQALQKTGKLTKAEQELLARYQAQPDLEPGEKPYETFHLHNQDPVPVEWRQGSEGDRAVAGEQKRARQGKARVIKQVRAAHAADRKQASFQPEVK